MLVIKLSLSPSYVMDEMPFYEMRILLDNMDKKDRESWEQTRFQSYITAQCNSTKTLKLTDIMKFDWDKEKEDETTLITNNDIERLREKAKNYIKQKNKNNE